MTIPTGQPEQGPTEAPGEERRHSQRVMIRVPLTLEIMKAGKAIQVSANTVAVNTLGAMVLSPRPLDAQTRLVIINERTSERVGARVTRNPRESAEGFLIPLEFDGPMPTFWQISFPALDWKPADG